MRLIGHLDNEASARTFGDYLFVQGVENQIEFIKGEGWGIWVNEEEKLQSASNLLAAFRENPGDAKYQTQAKGAEQLRAQQAADEEAWRKKVQNRRHLFRPITGYGFGPVTFVLISISVMVFVLSNFGMNLETIQKLFITQFLSGGSFVPPDFTLPEVRQGQFWRLVTPMFIHYNVMHIFFNLLWLRDLGSMIEGRQSSLLLAIMVLVIAAGSNVAQFYIQHNPNFGGMSGVVYGLLGYIWIRGKLDPGSGLYLHRTTVTLMAIWLVAGFTRILGPIANYAHLAGLVMGMVWGFVSAYARR